MKKLTPEDLKALNGGVVRRVHELPAIAIAKSGGVAGGNPPIRVKPA